MRKYHILSFVLFIAGACSPINQPVDHNGDEIECITFELSPDSPKRYLPIGETSLILELFATKNNDSKCQGARLTGLDLDINAPEKFSLYRVYANKNLIADAKIENIQGWKHDVVVSLDYEWLVQKSRIGIFANTTNYTSPQFEFFGVNIALVGYRWQIGEEIVRDVKNVIQGDLLSTAPEPLSFICKYEKDQKEESNRCSLGSIRNEMGQRMWGCAVPEGEALCNFNRCVEGNEFVIWNYSLRDDNLKPTWVYTEGCSLDSLGKRVSFKYKVGPEVIDIIFQNK